MISNLHEHKQCNISPGNFQAERFVVSREPMLIMPGKLDGIFTERDYARKVILKGRSSRETMVQDIMTESPVFVTPDTKIEECMQLMSRKYIRHLPVMENDRLVGIVSIGDIVKYIITQKDFIIENLQRYIVS